VEGYKMEYENMTNEELKKEHTKFLRLMSRFAHSTKKTDWEKADMYREKTREITKVLKKREI